MYKVNAFLNTDNVETFTVTRNGNPYTFDIDSAEVYTSDPNYAQVIDSSDNNVTWVDDSISIRFGRLNVPVGSYIVNLKLITDTEPNGVVVQSFLVNMQI